MNKLKITLNPRVARLILQKFPVTNRRTPLWFFKREIENIKAYPDKASNLPKDVQPCALSNGVKQNQVSDIWHKLDPEVKRRYFYLSESDEIRYREQKSLRLAKVISLLVEHGEDFEKVIESLPVEQDSQQEVSLNQPKNSNYERMLQIESTITLYKDLIEHKDKSCHATTSDDLITTVPKNFRPVLTKPRRPPGPFMLFSHDNKDRFHKMKKGLGLTPCKIAAIEWNNSSQEARAKYVDMYKQLLDEYLEAKREFKDSNQNAYIEQASREKKAFKKSIRRKLREHDVVPVNVRNAFNFFLMDHKESQITKLSEIWRNMSEDEKHKYKLMNQRDAERYYAERLFYTELSKSLDQLLSPKNTKRLLREQNENEQPR